MWSGGAEIEGCEVIGGETEVTPGGRGEEDKVVEAGERRGDKSVHAEDGLGGLEGCEARSRGIGDMRVVTGEGCEAAGRDKGDGTCGWVEMTAGADGVDAEATSCGCGAGLDT